MFGSRGKKLEAAVAPAAPLHIEPAPAAATTCQDCGAPISGNYCSNCGQETQIRTPTVRQFAHEMMDQYVAVEGKLGRTLRTLIVQPGQLTVDYIQGRRQRYVRPLKLYVSISVVFFGLLGLLPDSWNSPFLKVDGDAAQQNAAELKQGLEQLQQEKPAPAPVPVPDQADAADQGSAAQASDDGAAADHKAPAAPPPPAAPVNPATASADATAAAAKKAEEHDLKAEIERDIDAGIKSGNDSKLGETIKRHVEDEVAQAHARQIVAKAKAKRAKSLADLADPEKRAQLRQKLLDEAPYAMFFLLPYGALLLRWLYRKNKQLYGVHLLCSVHLHCFAFLLLMLMLLPWQPWRVALEWAGAAYVFLALRRVYGGTWKRTLWNMALIYMLYTVAIGLTAASGVLGFIFGGGS